MINEEYIIEKIFYYKGYICVVTFGRMGFRCGYVGLCRTNILYGKNHDDVNLICHGGLTYSSQSENDSYPIESDLWWFGFDCGHYGDGEDLRKAIELFPKYRECLTGLFKCNQFSMCEEYDVKSTNYVVDNCKYLVDQIIKLNKANNYE